MPDLFDTHEKVVRAEPVWPHQGGRGGDREMDRRRAFRRAQEMEEIEISSRLYSENGAYFMTATLPAQADGESHIVGRVTFVLAKGKLITVRYHEPRAFQTFPMRAENADLNLHGRPVDPDCPAGGHRRPARRPAGARQPAGVIDISHRIFHPTEKKASMRDLGFQIILRQIGREELFISNIQDSLVSLQRCRLPRQS